MTPPSKADRLKFFQKDKIFQCVQDEVEVEEVLQFVEEVEEELSVVEGVVFEEAEGVDVVINHLTTRISISICTL
jgi:hypothetical protein